MAFTQVQDLNADNSTPIGGVNRKTGKKNPISIEGYYLGSRKVENKLGESHLHVLQTSTGNQGVWGKTDMDRKLLSVTPGTMVRITYTGMQETKNAPMYKYKVEVDKENTIEVDTQTLSTPSDSDDSYSDSAYEADVSDDEDTDGDDYVALPQVVAATTAANKAKVQALLGKKK